jgi:hypothetical protein
LWPALEGVIACDMQHGQREALGNMGASRTSPRMSNAGSQKSALLSIHGPSARLRRNLTEKEESIFFGVRHYNRMSILRITALLGLLTAVGLAENAPSKRTLPESLREPWLTLKIGLYLDQGDDMNGGPYLLFQRISPSQVLLSRIDSHRVAEPSMPFAISLISEEEVARLIQRALVFYAKAEKELGEKARVSALPREQRESIFSLRSSGYGGSAAYITFDLLGSNFNRTYTNDFADTSDSLSQFHEFLEETTKKRK